MIRKKMITGTCECCGQTQMVDVGDLVIGEIVEDPEKLEQDVANRRATDRCGCPESQKLTAWRKVVGCIERICGPECQDMGFKEVSDETQQKIKMIARCVFDGDIEKAVLTVRDSQFKIEEFADTARVTRKATLEIGD